MLKYIAALAVLAIVAVGAMPAGAFGPKDLPIQDTSPGFGPRELPPVDGPGL